jgi:putative DNA primase/helicase
VVSEPLKIEVKPRNDRGYHLVIASVNGTSHKHRFDVDNQRDRKAFRETVINRFMLDDDAHEWIEKTIVDGAVTADLEGDIVECSTVRMSDVAPEQVEWLWRERFAIGKLTLIVGDPGQGKSFLTLDIAARISRGAVWPDNSWEPQQAGDVILLTAEDDLGDTIRPRLDALEADVSRIIAIKGAKFFDDTTERMVNLSTDLQSIRKVIQSANQPRAIIIDPVSAYLGKTDSHKNAEVRAVLAPLSELAAELRVAVIAVSHLRKGEGAALYRTMGSLAFIAAARSAWVVCKDEADQSRRLLLPLKSNIAPDVGGLAFTIRPHGPGGAATLCWEAEPVSTTSDDAIGNGQRKRGPAPDERTEVADWLREQLANGPRAAKEVIEDGDGIGFSKRTIQRAFREIGGASKVSGFPPCAEWSLANCANHASES